MGEEKAAKISLLLKEKAIIQAGHTRKYNAFEKLMNSARTVPPSTCDHYLSELEESFKHLEDKCNELFMLLDDDDDDKYTELNNLLTKKNDEMMERQYSKSNSW